MSLLEKSQDLLLGNFIKEKIVPYNQKIKDYKNFSLSNFTHLSEENLAFERCLKLFGEPVIFKPLTFPLDLSILEKIDLLKKYLELDFKYSFLIDYSYNKIKFIYPKVSKKEITLNPKLIKKLSSLPGKDIISSIDFLAAKDQFKIFKIYVPKNVLVACILYEKKSLLNDDHINNILHVTFS